MKTITTIAAIAALTTLAACGQTAEAPAEVTATEAANTEAVNADVAATEVGKPADEHVESAAPAADSK